VAEAAISYVPSAYGAGTPSASVRRRRLARSAKVNALVPKALRPLARRAGTGGSRSAMAHELLSSVLRQDTLNVAVEPYSVPCRWASCHRGAARRRATAPVVHRDGESRGRHAVTVMLTLLYGSVQVWPSCSAEFAERVGRRGEVEQVALSARVES